MLFKLALLTLVYTIIICGQVCSRAYTITDPIVVYINLKMCVTTWSIIINIQYLNTTNILLSVQFVILIGSFSKTIFIHSKPIILLD